MSETVQRMFAQIAPRYDLANDALSFGVHRSWRKRAVALAEVKPGMSVLDCATGTGDLALAFKRATVTGEVIGTDFCAEMIVPAPHKAARAGLDVRFEVADVLQLPYSDQKFDRASISFGIRNVDDPKRCLQELARVTKKGGRVVVLEFGQPGGLYGALYRFHSRFVMPLLGQLLTGNRAAYEYLPRTAAKFPAGESFVSLMKEAGCFTATKAVPLLFGTAWVYLGDV
jgi:demethylmenaquinone methyltransferase/2-methoxy-6-polyprenyl-1,4-benzoquinol methylase